MVVVFLQQGIQCLLFYLHLGFHFNNNSISLSRNGVSIG